MKQLLVPISCFLLALLVSCAPVRDRRTLNDMEAFTPDSPVTGRPSLQANIPLWMPLI